MGWHFCLAIHFYYSSVRDILFAAFPFILLLLFFYSLLLLCFLLLHCSFLPFYCTVAWFSVIRCVYNNKTFSQCVLLLLVTAHFIYFFVFFLYVHKMRQRKRNQNKFSEREKWKLTSIDFWSIFGDTCHFSAALSFCCVNSRTFSLNFTISRRFQH